MITDDPRVESVQGFVRGLAVIRCFREDGGRLTLTEVAKRAKLSRAGARRLLYTLCNENYAATDGKLFWLTPRILDLGYSYLSSMELWGFAQEYLENLRETLGESTSIAVLEGDDVVFVMRAQARRILTSALSVGSRIPAYAISLGRAMLATLPEPELDAYLSQVKLEKLTPHTVDGPKELREVLLGDRAQGYSIVSKELELGISGIGMPIRNRQGQTIAAISVNFHPDRALDPEVKDRILDSLRHTRGQIESVLQLR